MFNRKLKDLDIFTEGELQQIHEASLEILQKTGIQMFHKASRDLLAKNGAKVSGDRAYLPPEMVEELLKLAPEQFTLYARNPEKSVPIGGTATVLAPGYGAPFVMDFESGKRRDSCYADYVNFTRLSNASPNMDVVGGVLVEPTDIPQELRHARMFYASARHADKCLMGSALGEKKAQECVEMAAILFGGIDYVRTHPVLVTLINTNSPLQLDDRMMDALAVYARYQQPVVIASLSMVGTTAPATVAAGLVQQNAEIVAGIAVAQLMNPGTPVIYGSASSIVDLRTGGLAIGSPETAKMFAGTAQMGRFYNIPSRGGGALTDSVLPDVQSGYESMMLLMGSVSSGFNFILHAAGLLENYMTMSYEKFIIDDEICSMVENYFQGIPVDEEHMAKEVIMRVGSGGNFLAEDHTMRHMRDMAAPLLSSRRSYAAMTEIVDAARRAHERSRYILETYVDPALDPGVEKELLAYIESIAPGKGTAKKAGKSVPEPLPPQPKGPPGRGLGA